MQFLNNIVSFSIYTIFLITLLNFVSIRRLSPSDAAITSKVSILIPMRNEERNVEGSIESAVSQHGLLDFEVLVLDDQSEDRTFDIANSLKSKFTNLRLSKGGDLPVNWLGKNYALHTLSKEATGEYLVFLDADVRLNPTAIASAIKELEARGWSYISPYPKQLVKGFLANLVQPLLQWSWFSTLPLRAAEKSLLRSTVVANGQFFIARSDAYRNSGGHIEIKGEVLDDLELARLMRKAKFRGSVVDGSRISNCQMYENGSELIAGYEKSQWRAFGGFSGAALGALFLFLTSIYPAILIVSDIQLGIFLYSLIISTRLLAAIRTDSVKWSAPLHPLAIAIWIYLIFRSILLKKKNSLYWRGRQL